MVDGVAVNLLRVVPRPARSALAVAMDDFLLDREAMGCTAKTLEAYRYALGGFVAAVDVTALMDVTPSVIRQFLVDLGRRGLADTTVHLHARCIKTWCRWMVVEGLLPADPMARVSMPRLATRVLPALTADQVTALMGVASVRDRAVLLVLLDSGCRASEFVGLRVGDVDLRTGVVIVHQGKGRKDRVTFLGAKSRLALRRYLRTRGDLEDVAPLVANVETGEPLAIAALQQLLVRIGDRAGISPLGPHLFRRTFALFSLRAGADLHSLAAMMGHAGVEVLSHYLDLQRDDLHEVHKRCSPGDRLG